jgi:hypothetical protein
MTRYNNLRHLLTACMLPLLMAGCVSMGALEEGDPTDYMHRLLTEIDGDVRVSTSALSPGEAKAAYGVPLAKFGIQPIWIEVENNSESTFWLMSIGLDPSFFTPTEAADIFSRGPGGGTDWELEQRFRSKAFRNPIVPGATVTGFILTNLDEGVKMVEIDLVASNELKTFSFLASIPGFRADYIEKKLIIEEAYPEDEIINFTDDAAFRAALEALPCCVTNKKGTRNGDPLNLVIVGGIDDAFPALVRRGWHPTEATYIGSVKKMINSVMSGERYRYSPISPLYLYGRPQDLALQKARDNIHQRNHLRLWRSPMYYHGKEVWVGQISRDIGTRMTIHSPYLTTHKIDPDVDEALLALIQDLAYSQYLAKLGLVKGVGAASRDEPRKNLTTDPYYTDGNRGVLIFDERPTSLVDIELLPWEGAEGGMIEAAHGRDRP